MKFIISVRFIGVLVLFCSLEMYSQVGIGTTTPDGSSILDVVSSTQGVLIPRMTGAQRDGIVSPAQGLVIYNLDEHCLNFRNQITWVSLCNTPPSPLPASITLTVDQVQYIASVYDNDYLPYTTPSATATTGTLDADGTPEALPVNVQGVLTTTGITVEIPYTVSSGTVDLPAFSQTRTVSTSHVQSTSNINSTDGGGGDIDVEISYPLSTSLTGTGTITATIKAVGTDLNAVKLDLNSGLGTDFGILLAEFELATDDAGGTGTIELRDVPGIPDREFADASHQFLYLPVTAADGNVWLNNNLGANYSNLNHPSFSPTTQATAYDDLNAYGSSFQWGRYSDGHELINYVSSTVGTAVNGHTSTNSSTDTPGHNLFILEPNTPYDWRSSQNDNLWQGATGVNNPCPNGYRLPTEMEFENLVTDENITGRLSAASSNLAFTYSGVRGNTVNIPVNESALGFYWTSTVSTIFPTRISYRSLQTNTNVATTQVRAYSCAVRCIKD